MRTIGLILVAVLALAGCATAGPAPAAGTGWTYTDDLGTTVTLDSRPLRIAGLTDVVASLWTYDVPPVAAFGYTGITQDTRFAGRDLTGVTQLGAAYGQIDLEALAAAAPDLIVTHAYPTDSAGTIDRTAPLYGFADLAQQEAASKIAPIVAIRMDGTALEVAERTTALATALGADPAAIASTRATFDQAAGRLTAAAAKGLRVMAVAAYPAEGLYVAKAPDDPSLRLYSDLGVQFVDPGGDKYYWAVLSWENVATLTPDLVLESQLDEMSAAEILAAPTFALTPAAKARQLRPWVFATMDYPAQAAYMSELAGWLEVSARVT